MLTDSPWSYSETLLSTPEVPTASGLSSLVELAYCHCILEGARATSYAGSRHPLLLGCPIYPPFPTTPTDWRPDRQGPFLGLKLWTKSPMLIEVALKAGPAAVGNLSSSPHTVPQFPHVSQLPSSLPVSALRLMVKGTQLPYLPTGNRDRGWTEPPWSPRTLLGPLTTELLASAAPGEGRPRS